MLADCGSSGLPEAQVQQTQHSSTSVPRGCLARCCLHPHSAPSPHIPSAAVCGLCLTSWPPVAFPRSGRHHGAGDGARL